MYYVLHSKSYDEIRPSFTRPTTGEVVPARVFHIDERAVYRLKKVPGRFYRRDYPDPGDKAFFLAKFPSLLEAVELRDRMGDNPPFDIHEWVNGKLGAKVDI